MNRVPQDLPYRRACACLAVCLVGAGWQGNAWAVDPVFSNETTAAGITYQFEEDPDYSGYEGGGQPNLLDLVAGGAAAGDYDGDGWTDLFITRTYDSDILYRNNGNGTFSDMTSTAFPSGFAGQWTNGPGWGDIDNDGDLDLYVTGTSRYDGSGSMRHYLYVNDGAGHFTEDAVARGAQVGDGSREMGGSSVSFGDYDNDGYLDMYVGEWRWQTESPVKWARLLRNQGAANPGHFVDMTDAAGVSMDHNNPELSPESLSFTPRFVDFDGNGFQDLAVTSDFGTSRLFWNNGDGTFSDGTGTSNFDPGTNDMGSAIGDIDGDGRLDWFTTSIYQTRAHRYSGGQLFVDMATPMGGLTSPPGAPPCRVSTANCTWGWGAEIFDYDNDRDMDVTMTNGWDQDPFDSDQVILWRHNDGQITFTNVSNNVGMTDTGQGRGLLTFDYDRDGDLDLFVMNIYGPPVLYRNDGGDENDWLRIKTVGTISNADGIGAFITVIPDLSLPNKKLVTEIDGSSNFVSQSEFIAHFGLGPNSDPVDLIRIKWPASGIVHELYNVAPNQLLTAVEQVADYNGDGVVDGADYTVWRDSVGDTVFAGSGADGNGDTMVDELDFDLWRMSYGFHIIAGGGSIAGAGATASVPEPSTAALTMLGLLFMTGTANRARFRRKCGGKVPNGIMNTWDGAVIAGVRMDG